MKTLFLTAFVALTLPITSVFAGEVIKKFPAGGASDVLEDPKKPHGDAGGALKIKKDCTMDDGKVVTKGDPKYQACLKEKLEKPKK